MGIVYTNPVANIYPQRMRLPVTAKTANYTITSGESGTIFTNQGASGAVYFTLPSQVAGLFYIIANVEDQDLYVVADTADTLVSLNDVAADNVSLSTANLKAGGGFLVFADGTNWVALAMVYDTQTATVAT